MRGLLHRARRWHYIALRYYWPGASLSLKFSNKEQISWVHSSNRSYELLQLSLLSFFKEIGAPRYKVPAYQLWVQSEQKTSSAWLVTAGVLLATSARLSLISWLAETKFSMYKQRKSVVQLKNIWKVLIKVFWSSDVNTLCHVYHCNGDVRTWQALEKINHQWQIIGKCAGKEVAEELLLTRSQVFHLQDLEISVLLDTYFWQYTV